MLDTKIFKLLKLGKKILKRVIRKIEKIEQNNGYGDLDINNEDLYQVESKSVEPASASSDSDEKKQLQETLEFDLKPVRDFMDEYVGLVIIDYKAFQEDLQEFEYDISNSILTSVKFDNKKIYMNLSSLTGEPRGTIALSPTITGQFAERSLYEEPVDFSRYRISFMGGQSIEYLDSPKKGVVTFHEFDGKSNGNA